MSESKTIKQSKTKGMEHRHLLWRVFTLQWIKEWLNPKLVCERKGHDIGEVTIKVRKDATGEYGYRHVVDDFQAKRSYCKRCGGEHSEPYDLKHLTGYHSCSMPDTMWDKIRENGYVEM